MLKLTKSQRKDRERIEAWLQGRPFRENSRAKPLVPDLSTPEILESYVPNNISDGGKFFTPLEMAAYLSDAINFSFPCKVLEPCAGIGNLLGSIYYPNYDGVIDCYEIDRECVAVGQKLFPDANWHHAIPFDHVSQIESQYDLVLCNPPFGTTWGMSSGFDMCEGRSKRSEHIFLELALRALKPDGVAAFIAPYNFVANLPKPMREWVDKRVSSWAKFDNALPGEFRFTKIRVHLFVFDRNDHPVSEPVQIAKPRRALVASPDQLSLIGG